MTGEKHVRCESFEERALLTCWPRESTTCPGILFRYQADTLFASVRARPYEQSRESQSGRMIRSVSATREGKGNEVGRAILARTTEGSRISDT